MLRNLRRLIYCGEWLESHTLHLYLLHAPDFLGYDSGFAMAADHPEVVERGLRAKKVGNRLIEIVGGRAVHPINVRVGGFFKAPDPRELERLRPELERCRDEALETVRWCAGLDFPELERDYEFVSMRSPDASEYPIDRGRIVSSKGIDIAVAEWGETFEELHVSHSTALHARVRERGAYLCGPMARFALNRERLSPIAAEAASEAGLDGSFANPFKSIVVRAVEILYAFDEALRLIDAYERPDAAVRPLRAPRRRRPRRQRGAPRPALPPLRARRRGQDRVRLDRPAHLPEPALDRGGPDRVRRRPRGAARRRAPAPLRADDPQLRPLHLLLDPLPRARGRPRVTAAARQRPS